jgi:hypothetical protein
VFTVIRFRTDETKVLKNKTSFFVLLLFLFLTFIHLLPLSLYPTNSVTHIGDPLLNTWIISHVYHQLLSHPLKLFQANIFYPHSQTLAYSEILFPQSLISAPIQYLTKNPVLAYNSVFYLAYLLNGFSMFLLVQHLTKSHVIGMVCGVMFAFNTFNFDHITHLQLLHSWPIPLAFLYLHKFFKDKRLKNSILFSVFFIVQATCCIYYGLFFLSILILVLPLFLLMHRRKINLKLFCKLMIPLGLAGAFLFIISIPYQSLFKIFGFERGLSGGADLANFLAINPNNVLLSKFMASLGRHEYFLSPGTFALFLAAVSILDKKIYFRPKARALRATILIIVSTCILMITMTKLWGGFYLDLGIFHLSVHNVAKQILICLIIGLLFLFVGFFRLLFRPENEHINENRHFFLYFFILVWALFLSFGSALTFLGDSTSILPLPFKWFYNHVPGFKGIRMPSRYAIFVIFSTVLLAAFGLKSILAKFDKKRLAVWGSIGLLFIFNLEYLSLPQRIYIVPIKNDIPPTYRWLADRADDGPIIELPFHKDMGNDAVYMYFSAFHRKKMVNGYSGFIPPAISYIRKIFETFPSPASLDILKTLGIKYVVLHTRMFKATKSYRVVQRLQDDFPLELHLIETFRYSPAQPHFFEEEFGEDLIYEVISSKKHIKPEPKNAVSTISPESWTANSSQNSTDLPLLIDNDLSTMWSTRKPKNTGDYLLVEFEEPERVEKVSLFLGEAHICYGIRIHVETSLDGIVWERFRNAYSPGEFTKNLIFSPLDLVQNIRIEPKKIKYLKIIQAGNDDTFWWAVAEMKIYRQQD